MKKSIILGFLQIITTFVSIQFWNNNKALAQNIDLSPVNSTSSSKRHITENFSNQKLSVESIKTPPPLLPRTLIETAFTITNLETKLNSEVKENHFQDSQFSIPVLSVQLQRWLYRDFENSQHIGYILGMGMSDKNTQLYSFPLKHYVPLEILYSKLMAGFSFEKSLFSDRVYLGINTLFMEELWDQNSPQTGSRWSQWSPSLALSLQLKATLYQSWYGLIEAHHQIPFSSSYPLSNNQRLYIGIGYCL